MSSSKIFQLGVDARDPARLAEFWTQVLDMRILDDDPDEIVIGSDEHTYPGLIFLRVPEVKERKNRLHIDLVPTDQEAEIERIIGLGATRVEVGQAPDVSWAVLADPEGNEFCVLRSQESLLG